MDIKNYFGALGLNHVLFMLQYTTRQIQSVWIDFHEQENGFMYKRIMKGGIAEKWRKQLTKVYNIKWIFIWGKNVI